MVAELRNQRGPRLLAASRRFSKHLNDANYGAAVDEAELKSQVAASTMSDKVAVEKNQPPTFSCRDTIVAIPANAKQPMNNH